jgi:glyoxylase-like metal-dependent hydrolase (beta-lactamase superfamily II)
MQVKVFNNNDMGQNVYLYYDEGTGEGMLIDAGCSEADAKELAVFIKENGINIEAVFLTHGHYDHIIGAHRAKRITATGYLYCHMDEKEALENAETNRSALHGLDFEITPEFTFGDGCTIRLNRGKAVFKVLHTPGHTPGSVCYYDEESGVLFSGDTLFKETIGRTDFPTGSHDRLIRSLKEKLLTLPDATKVYPGHGGTTTIGHERKHNPFTSK